MEKTRKMSVKEVSKGGGGMAVHPLRQRCGGYHEPTLECSYCRWILQGDLEGLDWTEIVKNYEITVDRPDPDAKSPCPQCAVHLATIARLTEENGRMECFVEDRLEHCVSDQRGAYRDVLAELRRASGK